MSLLFATAFLTLGTQARQALQVNVDAKSGDVVSGTRTFKVTVATNKIVREVEFYVNGQLEAKDDSTPYLFTYDTLSADKDGTVKLRFKAYTTESDTGEKTIEVKVDNGLDKGADFHVKRAQDFLADSKNDAALDEARIALKIDSKNNAARIALARANLAKGVYDQAQRYAEDAIAQDPNDRGALELLAAINVQRAFRTYASEGTDRTEVLSNIREALKSAVDSRKKSLDVEIDRIGQPTDENLLPYADAAIKAERYSRAIEVLAPAFEKDQRNAKVGDRLAYAYLRSNRTDDAISTLNFVKKYGTLDAYGYALLAVADVDKNDDQASDAAMKEALLADPDNLGVKTAQAYIALKRNKQDVLSKLSTDLGKEQGQRADVNYFLMALANRQQRFGEARRYFERAVLAEPAYPDLYIEQGNYTIGLSQAGKMDPKDLDFQYESAKTMYETALDARPEAADALSGLAVVAMLQKKPQDALKYASAAVAAAPQNAGAHYTLAAANQAASLQYRSQSSADALKGDRVQASAELRTATELNAKAQQENRAAGNLDRVNLAGREIPDALAAWRYLNTGGRMPVLSAPK